MGASSKPLASDLATVGYKYIGTPYSTMDCQTFVERCLRDIGIKLDLSGSNAWYRRMTWRGSPEECRKTFGKIPAGAMLYIVEPVSDSTPSKYRDDGLGDAEHIGIYTATGKGAIHSSSSRGQVAESEFHGKTIRNGGWNMVGLWDRLDYGDTVNRILNGDTKSDSNGDNVPDGGGQMQTATVFADSGSTVKMRAKPDKACGVYWDVPIGDTVQVVTPGIEWTEIIHNGKTGWMMTRFLMLDESQIDSSDVDPRQGDQIETQNETQNETETVTVKRSDLMRIYDTLGDILGLRG